MNLAQLRARYDALGTEMRGLLDGAENGVLSTEDREKYDGLKQERAAVLATIEARRELEAEKPIVDADVDAGAGSDEKRSVDARVVADREADREFRSLGEQLAAVAASSGPQGIIDKRLLRIQAEARAASGQNEATASEGGFLVEQPLAEGIVKRMFADGEILSRVRRRPIGAGANGIRYNGLKEDSRADGSRHGGVRAYWMAEAGALTASSMDFEQRELRLNKLGALVYATQEMLDDVVFLDAEIADIVPKELRFVTEAAIVAGDGAGKPLGYRSVSAYIAQAKENSQTAATINTANVAKMMARMPAGSYANAVWLVDQTALSQLPLLTVGNQPVWTANFQESPYGNLLGRPVIAHEHGATLGTLNDIDLVDLSEYMFIDRGGIRGDVSMHVRFLYDEMAFRFTYRCDGGPIFRSPLTPKSGGDTQSPFVGLATRA